MAKVIQFEETGGPEVLSLREVPSPPPGAGEVLIRVEAVGVNPLEWKQRSGMRPLPPSDVPYRIGSDGAGVITAVGEGVEGLREGLEVAFASTNGAYATEVIARAENVYARPASVSAPEAAALGIPAGTAYQVMRSMAVGQDDMVLVHGASGSVGQSLVQFLVNLGATVIGTASAARLDTVRDLGAIAVEYGDGLIERIQAATTNPVTVAIDCAGTDEAIHASLELVSDASRIATIVRGLDAEAFGIRAFLGGSPIPLTEQEFAWRREAVPVALSLMAANAYRVELGNTYPLADAGLAQADNQSGAAGKLILVP